MARSAKQNIPITMSVRDSTGFRSYSSSRKCVFIFYKTQGTNLRTLLIDSSNESGKFKSNKTNYLERNILIFTMQNKQNYSFYLAETIIVTVLVICKIYYVPKL